MKLNFENKKINILFVDSGWGYGGSTSFLYSFLKYLDMGKFNPKVMFYKNATGVTVEKIRNLGVEVIAVESASKKIEKVTDCAKDSKMLKSLKLVRFIIRFLKHDMVRILKIAKIINRDKVDIAFFGSDVNSNIDGILAAKLTGKLCVVRKSGRGNDANGKRMGSLLSRLVDIFIASSNAEANEHKNRGFSSRKMFVIYEGIDLDYFRPLCCESKFRHELGLSSKQFVFGYISRIDIGKGQPDFIKAANLVLRNYPETVFLIIGEDIDSKDGYLRRMLEEEVRKLKVDKNVLFLGWRNDIVDILQSIDVFVHCPDTWCEGMGIATLEALACGKPTIITNNCGLAETAQNNYNGFIIPVGDHKLLSERMIELINNRELVRTMGNNSRIYAETNFDIRKNVARTESILLGSLKSSK